jgi:glucose-6-phosphate isomerase
MTETTPPAAWQALLDHRRALAGSTLADLFAADPQRFTRLSLVWDDWLVDWSKQRLTPATMALLVAYARARNLPAWIEALFDGEKINLSEHRAALHTALRQQGDTPVLQDGSDVLPAIRATQARMRTLAAQLRGGVRLGATGRPIRDVIHIGIGGPDLGPRLVCSALTGPRASRREGIDVTFVSNVDPEQLTRALAGLDPATTLFIVSSKTFATTETLRNATSAREWLAAQLGGGNALAAHFIAVTANAAAARAFGVAGSDVLPLWDWVGGRFSLWSAVGLAIAVRCGWESFAELLAGAATMDAHFRHAPLPRNLPVLLALVDFWNAQAPSAKQRLIVPYAHALSRLPSYLQQLVLESNGKSVTRDGAPVDQPTAPGLWANRAPTASTRSSSGCIRARTRFRSSSWYRSARHIRWPITRRCSSPMRWHRRRRFSPASRSRWCAPSSPPPAWIPPPSTWRHRIASVPATGRRPCCCCPNSTPVA